MGKISLDQEKLTLVKKLAPSLTVLAGLMDAIAFHKDLIGSKILRFGSKFIILIAGLPNRNRFESQQDKRNL